MRRKILLKKLQETRYTEFTLGFEGPNIHFHDSCRHGPRDSELEVEVKAMLLDMFDRHKELRPWPDFDTGYLIWVPPTDNIYLRRAFHNERVPVPLVLEEGEVA